MKKITVICLILLFMVVTISVCYAQQPLLPQQSVNTAQADDAASIQPTEPPQKQGFELQWYHYAIAAAIIFGMCIYTLNSVKPATK